MSRSKASVAIVAALACAIFCGAVFAESQEPFIVRGRVVDPVNLPLPGTVVALIPTEMDTPAVFVLAGDDGRFVLSSVPRRRYVLRLEEQGFLTRKIQLSPAETDHEVDVGSVMLPIGEITEGPFGVTAPLKKIKPISVCEAIAGREKLNGQAVAIVGRIDCEHSMIDRVCFLTQDRCEQGLVTHGYAWPNHALVVDYCQEGMPGPPRTSLPVDERSLARKLSQVRKTTALGWHNEPRFKTEGRTIKFSHHATVRDEWGIVYGVLFTVADLRKSGCGNEPGCGGFIGAPIALITTPDALRTIGE